MTSTAERTVFVVDDDAAALDSLVMLLRSDGLNPSGFSSATSFLEALTPEARGCVISDVRMPGMDGVLLLKTLKSMHCILPVIVITGHADVTVAVQAMKAGAAEFVQKPYESELILRMVRTCWRRTTTPSTPTPGETASPCGLKASPPANGRSST